MEKPEEELESVQSFEPELLRMDLLCLLPPSEEMLGTHLHSLLSAAAARIESLEAVERPFSSYTSFLSFYLSLSLSLLSSDCSVLSASF